MTQSSRKKQSEAYKVHRVQKAEMSMKIC